MPTDSGKSILCKCLSKLVQETRLQCGREEALFLTLDDQSFGELMQKNHRKLLGLYDELPMFLSRINVCRGHTLADSQQVAN